MAHSITQSRPTDLSCYPADSNHRTVGRKGGLLYRPIISKLFTWIVHCRSCDTQSAIVTHSQNVHWFTQI